MARPTNAQLQAASEYFDALENSPTVGDIEGEKAFNNMRTNSASPRGGYGAGFYGGGSSLTYHKGLPAYLGGQGPGGWASNHFAESQEVVGWAFCAVRAIARSCARAERKVFATGDRARKRIDRATKDYKRNRIPTSVWREYMKSITGSSDGDDAVPVGSANPLLKLINRPNPYQSPAQFQFQFAQQVCVTGTSLLWTRRNNYTEFDKRGVPNRAYIIPTGIAAPLPPSTDSKYGAYMIMPIGSYGGAVTDEDGFADAAWSNLMLTGGVIDGRQIRPIRWPHPLFLTDGLSPMAAGELWIDVANQLDRTTWASFKNSLRPGMIFGLDPNTPEPNNEEMERFSKQLESRNSGVNNAGKHVLLPPGVGLQSRDGGPQELDYANGRQVIGRDVLALWATPPVACGVQEAGAYAAYFAALLQYYEQCIQPILDLLSDDATHEWAPAFGGEYEVKYSPPPINDAQQKLQELSLDVQARGITYNEYRKKMGYDEWPEPFGSMQVGKDIPSPWEMDQINTDLASGQQDLENQQNDMDNEAAGGDNAGTGDIKQPDATAGPPRKANPGQRMKSLRKGRQSRKSSFGSSYEVPGYFVRRGAAFIPMGVVNGLSENARLKPSGSK